MVCLLTLIIGVTCYQFGYAYCCIYKLNKLLAYDPINAKQLVSHQRYTLAACLSLFMLFVIAVW